MVAEIIKQRFNHGEANGVYFFRDKAGLESDVLVHGHQTMKLVEVKAGQTIASDWAASSRKIAELFAKTNQAVSAVVVSRFHFVRSDIRSKNSLILLHF